MTPDLKRLCDRAYAACEDRALLADTSDAEAIVRAVLTELREVSPSMERATDLVERVGDDGRWIRGEADHEFAAMIDAILAEPATA